MRCERVNKFCELNFSGLKKDHFRGEKLTSKSISWRLSWRWEDEISDENEAEDEDQNGDSCTEER